jgi:hypothetical protein
LGGLRDIWAHRTHPTRQQVWHATETLEKYSWSPPIWEKWSGKATLIGKEKKLWFRGATKINT